MGLIWKNRSHAYIPQHALVLQEPVGTISNKWPILAYFGQYWCLLKTVTEKATQPYYIYRSTDGQKVQRYHFLVRTPHALVQVGPERTYFWAETRTHQPLMMTYTGIKKAGVLVRKKVSNTRKELNRYLYTKV